MAPLLKAGVTHDLVVHVNDSVTLGLAVSPGTYRVTPAPTFLPRFAVGDPKGIDRGRWKSWIQDRWDGGAGQLHYSGATGNNRFAESHLIDIGLPTTTLPAHVIVESVEEQHDINAGAAVAALLPRATTADTPLATLFTQVHKVFVHEHSNRPLMLHNRAAVLYTNITGTDVFLDGAESARVDALTGKWTVQHTQLPNVVLSAVRFSGVTAAAFGLAGDTIGAFGDNGGIRLFGAAVENTAAKWYSPVYSTNADRLGIYDNKLWRACINIKVKCFSCVMTGYVTSKNLKLVRTVINQVY